MNCLIKKVIIKGGSIWMFDNLFVKGKIGIMEIKNRIVFIVMGNVLVNFDGIVF